MGALVDLVRLQAMAEALLDPITRDYIAGGVGDRPAANGAAWQAIALRPHVLRDVSTLSTTTTVLGQEISSPLLVAPTAMHRLVHPDGERATVRAAAAFGTVYVLSMAATTALEDVAAEVPGAPRWMQLYALRDRGLTRAVCERARDAGYGAIVLTVDAPVSHGNRTFGRRLNDGLPFPNLAPGVTDPDISALTSSYDDALTFDDLALVKDWSGLPLVVKGVLRGDDALACLDHGADAIAVSNHGGRQLDGCLPTAFALVEVAAAVGDRAEVYVDGGVRSGADVLKALALGARAVMIGRPVLWGLAVDGAVGAQAVLQTLHVQLLRALGLSGVTDVTAVPPDLVIQVTSQLAHRSGLVP